MTHRSFESLPWVKVCLLVMGGWTIQNSALIWCADHIRHHAHTMKTPIRTMRRRDFGTAMSVGCLSRPPTVMIVSGQNCAPILSSDGNIGIIG
jgi:hypothetical protein